MRIKHFLFALLTALCLVTAWAQPFDADIRQTADYKQAQTWVPVLLRDNASSYVRQLSGNTNQPFSGTVPVIGTNGTNILSFINGILISVQ